MGKVTSNTKVCSDYDTRSVLCLACDYPQDIKCCKKVTCFYECDYRKNTECPKTHCAYLGAGICSLTIKKPFAKSLVPVMVKEE